MNIMNNDISSVLITGTTVRESALLSLKVAVKRVRVTIYYAQENDPSSFAEGSFSRSQKWKGSRFD